MRYALYVAFALVAALLITAPLGAADAQNYRVVEGRQYQILEAKQLYIYSLDVVVRKGATERNYFFSVGPTGDIKPLTITNLKNAFPNNHRFHDNLDMVFKNDAALIRYDEFHKMFKVNRLLEASEQ
jgi:hypothetical protein